MGTSKYQFNPHMPASALETCKERLARLLSELESRQAAIPLHLEEPLAKTLDHLEKIFESLSQADSDQESTPQALCDDGKTSLSESFLQPVEEILNCIPDSHIVTSSDGIIQLANKQAAELFHVTQQQLTGLSLADMIVEDDWMEMVKRLQTLHGDVQNWQGEIQVLPHSRPRRSAICTLSALRDTRGRLVGAHWLLWDVTEHRHGIMAQELSHEISRLLLSGMTVRQALSIFCRRLVETFGYPLVWIGTRGESGSVKMFTQDGDATLLSRLKLEHENHAIERLPVVSRAIQERKTHIVKLKPGEREPETQWLCALGVLSQAVVPLATDEKVLGALSLCSQQPDAFQPSVVGWLEQLGLHINRALCLAQNYEQLLLQGKALNYAEHAVCITSPDGKIEWVNDAYCRMSGYEVGEVVGTILPSSQCTQFRLLLDHAADPDYQGQSWKIETTETRKDGREYTAEEVLTPLLSEDGRVSNVVAIFQDITSRKEAEAQIIHRVYHDPLTELPNRLMFQDRLEQALAQARRHQRLLAVLFIDLDCFKRVNDEFGHQAGDQLLRTVAERLSGCVRATDTVARLCGDEFTLILQDLEHPTDAQHVAQKILDCIGQPIWINGQMIHVRTSIGISVFPNDSVEPEDLLCLADRAMYRAKEIGGQGWAFSSGVSRSSASDSTGSPS